MMGENNNVVKNDKWCLEIVNNDDSDSEVSAVERNYLNFGKTTIGRNVKADLITDSEFASRNHCFIELNDSDELFLTDSSSNGTYVNVDHVKKQRARLKMNDLIGIGCTVDSLKFREVEIGDKTLNYRCYVYKLINCAAPQIEEGVIVLSDDDEENESRPQNDIKRESIEEKTEINQNGGVKNGSDYSILDLLESGDEMLIDCVTGGATDPAAKNEGENGSIVDLGETDDDNDIEQNQWSQQMVLDIKQEAQHFVISDDEDESIAENCQPGMDNDNDQGGNESENDYDDDTSKWLSRLSQDQDKVKEKSAYRKQEKRAKMIESRPMKRRQSISGRASTTADSPKRRKSISSSSSASGSSSPLGERRKSISTARSRILIKIDGFIKPRRHEADKKDLTECRKARLLEIAQNQQLAKLMEATHSKERVVTKPKVKIAESRGAFLQEPIAKEKKRLKSKSEVDENRKQHQIIGVPSTSKGPPKENDIYVDYIDPFAVGLRKSVHERERKKTLDEVFAAIDEEYNSVPKKRTSRVMSRHASATTAAEPMKKVTKNVLPVSILKKASNGNKTKKMSVHFRDEDMDEKSGQYKELADLFEFEAKENEDHVILVSVPDAVQIVPRSDFQSDPLHRIISEVTTWNVEWLLKKNKMPPITDVDYVITPLLNKYPSFEVFQNTITPLLKHELWASIMADTEKDQNILHKKARIIFNEVNRVKRGADVRIVYHCEVAADCNQRIFSGDLVVVTNGALKFFAYVTNQRTIHNGYTRRNSFSMEAAPLTANDGITRDTLSVTVTPISNIRTELKLFSAVYSLRNSAMKQYILNPLGQEAFDEPPKFSVWKYSGYDPLNKEQMEVLQSIYSQCLSQTPGVSLVEGPPGTGKSRLIVNLILQLVFGKEVSRRLRILVCAHSNAAVDILALKLMKIHAKTNPVEKQKLLRMVRFGVVDSMDRDVRSIALQNLVKNQSSPEFMSPQTQTLLEEKNQLATKIEAMSKTVANADNVSADYWNVLRRRLNQINETMERKSVNTPKCKNERRQSHHVMTGANIIFTTLSSSINLKQYMSKFDVCIIDEASQCIEPWSMIPLLFDINSLILVGDSQQLPAVVLSTVGRDNNLERSLFTRLQEICADVDHKPNSYSLCQQYRMHPDICHWSNNYFYHKRLVSAPNMIDTNFQLNPYGVLSLDFFQSCNDGGNYRNSDEAKFIIDLLKIIVRYADPKHYSYGIITPYSTQRKELQTHINTTSELSSFNFPVNTIDSYQGQEKDIIIFSTTRTAGVGFLSNPQRLNVALTRAKRCLLVCGNFTSVKQVRVWNSLIKDATERRLLHPIPRKYTENDLLKILLKPAVYAENNKETLEAAKTA